MKTRWTVRRGRDRWMEGFGSFWIVISPAKMEYGYIKWHMSQYPTWREAFDYAHRMAHAGGGDA